ncbi:surface exclusion protein [Streptococcus mitis]|uniref:Surface exclusion protein n=2 Tax=Streptococcus mitis TaxID=28037 RepID=A0A1X1JZ78_STRMT|nr:surface exclusion protein [Streptococcus mitis]
MMKKLQTLTTSTAIALASVGGTAFAQEAQATPVSSNTAVNEPALVAKSQVKPVEKTEVPAPSTVKPALDAQKAVVKYAETKIDTAKTDVKAKEATVASTEKEVATATQAVKNAQATTAQASYEKVTQVKEAQAKNVEAQTANQKATEATNEQIKAESKALAEEQSDVASAQANLDQANKDVQTAEQALASAQSALDGTGLASAQKDLKDAQKDVKDAEDTVADAQTAFKNATKADADRDQAIKSAETDVNTKNDAVKLAKEKLASATEHADSVESKLQSAQAELKSAQDKLANTNTGNDTVTIADLTQFKKDKAEGDSDFMTDSGATVIENSSTKISEADKNKIVELDNLTDEQQKEISLYASKVLTEIHKQFGLNEVTVTDSDLRIAREQAKKYVKRGIAVNKAGHINGAYHGENISLANETKSMTMYELKQKVYDAIMGQTFADASSKWGHSHNNFVNNTVGIATANVDGRLHIISTLDLVGGNVIKDETDTASLEKAVATAKSNVEQAKTASENAKNALTKASTDYASALSLKTDAEKVLADAMATPLQAQVAENNLRLAEIALENAKTREAKANEAIANFSASLVDKKATLAEAQTELEGAKAVQTTASQALADASAKLKAQEDKVNALNKQSAKLLEEKDALVKEAKKLAEKLQAYLDAPAKLATAKDMKAKAEAKLETAKAELTTAQSTLENLLSAYRTEHAKLVDLQAEYEALVDLAEKAQENVVAKLPDGTVIAVPKVAPTAEALPEVNVDELQKALATGKEVTLDAQGNVVVKEKRETYSAPAVKSVENEKMSYSRVEKAKTLPNTGESSSVAMLVLGAILGTFGLVTVRRKN